MSQEIIGQWEELMLRRDLRGHKVKVIVMDEEEATLGDKDAWRDGLERLMAGAVRTGQEVDTSRESIYNGTLDDTH